ncbi:MAG: MFS transporter [Lachnospiraceae bacterium]|nr:MFS transporter [Lachnospiraceae bacterium]
MKKLTRQELNWVLYDVGNSAFVMLISTIVPIYFNHLAESAGISSTDYLAYWGYAASIVTLIVVLCGPFLGGLSDLKDMKKKLFAVTLLIGTIGCACLGIPGSWIGFLLLFILSKAGYSLSVIFYDSMLTDITDDSRMDHVSSSGYAWGYIGSCIPFIASLVIVLCYDSIGISFSTAMVLAFLLTAVWWFAMAMPLYRSYKQSHYAERGKHLVLSGFRNIGRTLKDMKNKRYILLFVISFFFYIDGVYTIIDMATAYGEAVGLDTTGLLLALLVTQIVAFPFALLFGRLAQKYRTEDLITVCIIAYLGIAVFAIFLDQQWEFWLLAVCVGMFQGGIQALSRSYFTKIIPAEKSGEYFGILDICGKGAAFVGTTIVSVVTQLTRSASKGVSTISVLMLLGLILFRLSVSEYHKSRAEE